MDDALSLFLDPIKAAIAAKRPLRIRGGGSKDFYGEAIDPSLPLLDTRGYSGIVSYEPSELVITAKAGTPLTQVEAALREKNQCLAFEPPHYTGGATVGGMVAAGLSGPSRAVAGSVRDYVLGAHMINGQAQLLQFGGTVIKNVAGYDLSRLLAGSMGTLGLITQVSLKVLPVAPAEATLRFDMTEAEMIQRVNDWAGQPLPINASSWVIDAGRPTLYLRLRGAVAAVESACQMLAQEHSAQRVDSPQTTADWSAARDLKLPWFEEGFKRGEDLWRISVPPTSAPLELGDTMIDWLGGQRWLFAASGDASAAQQIHKRAQNAGGHATLFIASYADFLPARRLFGSQNAHFSPQQSSIHRTLASIHTSIKQQFDPAGIFNPGRLGVI